MRINTNRGFNQLLDFNKQPYEYLVVRIDFRDLDLEKDNGELKKR